MGALVVIPARLGSTRFPAKVLASETGRPLVQHVVDRLRACRRVESVVVATDAPAVADALRPFGTTCVLTSPSHPSGTDRVAEVARNRTESIVVNVQGDEPEIDPDVVDRLIDRLARGDDQMVTAATPLPATADPADPNLVKVVRDRSGYALYFSRSPIPYHRDGGGVRGHAAAGRLQGPTPPSEESGGVRHWLHLGIYGYRREFLLTYASWPPTPLELTERLEQLRALENGVRLYVVEVAEGRAAGGIDTAEQYRRFVERHRQASDAASQGRRPAETGVAVERT